jgi:hypothetical protein
MRSRPEAPLTGRLIVVLSRDAVALIAERASGPAALSFTALGQLGEALGDTELVEALDRWADSSFPAIRSLSTAKILELDRIAAEGPFPPSRSMTAYWIVVPSQRVEPGVDPQALLIVGLRRSPAVERVELERQVGPPPVNRTNNDYAGVQAHLDPAPTGIDADWVWTTLTLDGAGISFADVERGWLLTHEDLKAKMPAALLTNQNNPGRMDHGAAVLGLVVGVDNDKGIVGVAPGVTTVHLASHWDGTSSNNVADAIEKAADVLTKGDVLLLETQSGDEGPIETQSELERNAIKTATSKGIVVIEAAGNAGEFTDTTWPELADDTGAIVVGASDGVGGAVPHPRNIVSNYGTRVDCFATGQGLVSAGFGDLDGGGGDDDKEYTKSFSDTSGASAILAGAAILAQHMHVDASGGARLDSAGMRLLLTQDGTKQGAADGNIGIMPDLRKVARRLCDVYVRDYIGDTGTVPSTGPLSSSPDVIVLRAPVGNAQDSFGEASGTENNVALGEPIIPNQSHHVYVRIRNRGMCPAHNVRATVYWSEVATLVTPDAWKLVGTSAGVLVPPGDVLTVAPAISWGAVGVPAPGHYCFVVMVDHPYDPQPPSAPTDWNGFLAFIREFNNVSWRNFNVVDPELFSIDFGLWFRMRGFPDFPRPFDFEVEARLPPDMPLVLEGPSQLLPYLRTGRFAASVQVREKRLRVQLPPGASVHLPAVRLDGEGHRCRFYVAGKHDRLAGGPGLVIIRQLYEGKEVGRVTWVVRPVKGVRRDHR